MSNLGVTCRGPYINHLEGGGNDDRAHRPQHRRRPQGRLRGDSIIFDPTSFLMGGIHEAWDID